MCGGMVMVSPDGRPHWLSEHFSDKLTGEPIAQAIVQEDFETLCLFYPESKPEAVG